MPTVHEEVEAKYEADADLELPGLVELIGPIRGHEGAPADDGAPWAEGDGAEQHLRATYYDTAALDLAAAGLTLRRRTGGEDAGWHLKVPVADATRSEIRHPLDDGGPDDTTVPDALVSMIYARTRGRDLVPVAEIDTNRTLRRLIDPTGRVLLELADDHVTARRIHWSSVPGDASGAETTWREIEVELVDGPRELLLAVDPVLRTRGLTPATAASKLVRALGEATVEAAVNRSPVQVDDARTGTGKGASAADVALAHIGAQVQQIWTQDLPVRLDQPGSVHAMRVASRRLRSALTTFEPLFDRTATRIIGTELRWLAGVLGAARDAEVMRDRVTAAVAHEREDTRLQASVSGVVSGEVSGQLDDVYRRAHDGVLTELGSARYRVLLTHLEALLERPPLTERAHRAAGKELPRLVERSYERLSSAMTSAQRATDPAEREERLHDARKAAKRARYAAESVAPVFGKDARDFAAAMEGVQEALGEHLDSLNTQNRLWELASQTPLPSTAFTYGRLHAQEDVRSEASAALAQTAWGRASKKRLRRWLS